MQVKFCEVHKAFIFSQLWYFWKIKMLKFYLDVKTILYAFLSSTLVDLYIGLFFLFQVKMPHVLGYWWCWGEIHFIASLFVYLLEKFVIIWLVFERVDLNLNYVYDIELGYCFSLLVVIECSCYDYMSICHWKFGIYGISQCKIQNINFKEKYKKNVKYNVVANNLSYHQWRQTISSLTCNF